MLNFNSVLIGSANPKGLVEFYGKVFDKKPEWESGDFVGWKIGSGYLVIGPHDKVQGKSANPERIILNFETTDVKSEYERVLGVGADSVQGPYNPGEEPTMLMATLADPDGNFFQLNTPMEF